MRSQLKALSFLLVMCVGSLAAEAAVTVSPASPRSSDSVFLEVANAFGMEASVVSASFVRAGNVITINQVVRLGCFLPSNPGVRSSFDAGSLPPGLYTATATITFVSELAGCARPPMVQETTFTVSAVEIPTLSTTATLALLLTLAGVAVIAIRNA